MNGAIKAEWTVSVPGGFEKCQFVVRMPEVPELRRFVIRAFSKFIADRLKESETPLNDVQFTVTGFFLFIPKPPET